MIKTKMLGALMILSATLVTPALAQQAGKRAPAGGHGLVSQTSPRGAYNQVGEPSYGASRKRDRFSPENSGTFDRDPSIAGGEDTTRRAASS